MRWKKLTRVDVQVSIFTAIIIIFSSTCIGVFNYRASYNNMINNLTRRVLSIYSYTEISIDKSAIIDINSKDDESKEEYKKMKETLKNINKCGNISYSYIAKENGSGDVIYVVDGLTQFDKGRRYPGEKVDSEVDKDVRKALGGKKVLPKDIKDTKWGKILTAYFPIYNDGKTIGVIGIQFNAEQQYNTYLSMRVITLLVVYFTCIISIMVAIKLFKRISNPTYRDLYNTDKLTEVKNRNAYDTDIKNIIARRKEKRLGVIVIDLNSLKNINDNLGHQTGDEYIKCAAKVIKKCVSINGVVYRTGGDEFVVLVHNTCKEELENIINDMKSSFEIKHISSLKNLSMAIGYALYDEELDRDVNDTYYRSDREMYKDKKEYYKDN